MVRAVLVAPLEAVEAPEAPLVVLVWAPGCKALVDPVDRLVVALSQPNR